MSWGRRGAHTTPRRSRLRGVRERAGFSIRELADRAHVAPSTVWRIETGRLDPTVGMLDRLIGAAQPYDSKRHPTREAVVSMALGRLTAAALLRDPEPILRRARQGVARTLNVWDIPG